MEETLTNTVIGSSIIIDGEVLADEDLVIQGTVKGKIVARESVVIEPSGVVEADIETQNIEVAGQVIGNIVATGRVELKSQCRVESNVSAQRILIEDGTSFQGNVNTNA